MKAIAGVNRASGRTTAMQLELTMRIGDRDRVAKGELISHPSGLARLELRGFGGRIDRYLLSGAELLGAKDGESLERPQPMLQPLFLLQPSSEETLRAALETFGVESQWIGLAPCGDLDCFVIGDPRLAPAEPEPLPEDPLAGFETASGGPPPIDAVGRVVEVDAGEERLAGPRLAMPGTARIPRLWVDTQDLQVRRIDRANGVFVIFGPVTAFERLMVPAWFEIYEPGKPSPIRFEVDRAVQVNAPPTAFSRRWLLAPPVPAPSPGAASGPVGPDPSIPEDPRAADRP
ncbi:MAG: hypothetical protein CL908_07630 [Deltaproteobacteria bacterium]|nr:hypothetical protein [Deltaproteobacteria bacterium]